MLFYEILQSVMDEKNLNIPDVARLSGLPDSTIRSIISRKNKSVALEVAFKLSKGLDVPIDRLNGDSVTKSIVNQECVNSDIALAEKKHMQKYRKLDAYGKEMIDSILDLELERFEDFKRQIRQAKAINVPQSKSKVKLPLYELPVSAGCGVMLDTDIDFKTIAVASDSASREADYAVQVSGDSMEPDYYDGDILFVKSTPRVDEGKLGIFVLNGDGYFKEFGGNCLVSYNDKYEDIMISSYDSFYVKGEVLGKA